MAAMGLAPFSWQDLNAYCQISGKRIAEDVLVAVRIIDAEYFASSAAASERRTKSK